MGIDFFVILQPAHDRTKAELKRDAFTYDEHRDVYLYPNGKALRPKRLYRSGSGSIGRTEERAEAVLCRASA